MSKDDPIFVAVERRVKAVGLERARAETLASFIALCKESRPKRNLGQAMLMLKMLWEALD